MTYPSSTTYPTLASTYPSPTTKVVVSLYRLDPSGTAWLRIDDRKARSVAVLRGGESELQEIDAGTATLVVDNRDRALDPTAHPEIGPMNKWRVRAELATATLEDVFVGYAESYRMGWPDGGWSDSVCTVACVDESKRLALGKLPAMSPPRPTFEEYMQVDSPTAYWRFSDVSMPATAGPGRIVSHGFTILNQTPIVGDKVGPFVSGGAGSLSLASGQWAYTDGQAAAGQAGNKFTVGVWFRPSSAAATGSAEILRAPLSDTTAGPFWRLLHNVTTGTVTFEVTNNSGTVLSATSVAGLTADAWCHIVGVLDGSIMRLYVNGVEVKTASFSGVMLDPASMTADSTFNIGNAGATYTRAFDELAIYSGIALTAQRVQAQYEAATTRGFAAGQASGARINAVLDAAGSTTPRAIRSGVRLVQGSFMTGQSPLEEMRKARTAENVDAMLFIARDGTITFLDAAHRSVSPWNTVQATFDDDGTDLPYEDVEVDYSDAFLVNVWNVTKDGGTTQVASDPTSIDRYFERPQSISDLPVTLDTDAAAVASGLLAKTKDPFQRITAIVHNLSDLSVAAAVVPREIGDRVRILRTQPGGGRLDQTSFVRRIELSWDNSPEPPRVKWAVSPL